MRRTTLATIAVGSGLALALTACGANSSSGSSNGASGGSSNIDCSKVSIPTPPGAGTTPPPAPAFNPTPNGNNAPVGVILPDTASSARYQAFDTPFLQKALTAEGLKPTIENAQGDDQKFTQIADSMLSQHVKVLIIDPPDSDTGAQVEQQAKQQGVPVIDYDRLNLGGSANYYVSFDNTKVGELQGYALATALKSKPGAQVIEIEGSPTDNNAALFHNGQEQIVKPLYQCKKLNLVKSQFIDGWDNQKGGQTFEQFLTANGGKVDGVLAANDGLAGAVITVLQKNGLAGKVPVTGQDATAAGLQAILANDQYSSVFKPEEQEADAAAELASALLSGGTAAADKIASQSIHDPQGNRDVKSVLLQPQLITKNNVKTVVTEGYVKAGDICTSQTAAVCQQLGIS